MERTKNLQPYGLPDIGIPAEVLFNPKLSSTQKILFGFIRNLSHTEKGCWASNRYLAKMIGVKDPQTVTNGVSKLKKLKYIHVELTVKNGIQGRRIYINKNYLKMYDTPIKKLIDPYKKINTKYVSNSNTIQSTSKNSPTQIRNKPFLPLADYLYETLLAKAQMRFGRHVIPFWADDIRKLSEINGIDIKRISSVLRWYHENIGGDYIPIVKSGDGLRRKFVNLENAMGRLGGKKKSEFKEI